MEIEAFKYTPKEKPILFDHSVLKITDKTGITISCGNTMALSAPGKGLSLEDSIGSKVIDYLKGEEGERITKEWFKYVENERKKLNGEKEIVINEDSKKGYLSGYIKIGELKKGNPDNYVKLCQAILDTDWWKNTIESMEILSSNDKSIIKDKFKEKVIKLKENPGYQGRIDKIYQLFFDNSIWGAQKLGGFEIPLTSEYKDLISSTIDKKYRVLKNDSGGKKAIEFVNSCITENDGVLFLCESALFPSDAPFKSIYVEHDSQNGKSYSACWEKHNIIYKPYMLWKYDREFKSNKC